MGVLAVLVLKSHFRRSPGRSFRTLAGPLYSLSVYHARIFQGRKAPEFPDVCLLDARRSIGHTPYNVVNSGAWLAQKFATDRNIRKLWASRNFPGNGIDQSHFHPKQESFHTDTKMWDSYDPKKIAHYYRWRFFTVFGRAFKLFSEILVLRVRRSLQSDIRMRAVKFRESLIRLGPFYIKLGQALSTRPDMVPGEYCAELSLLQDQIPPFPTPQALSFLSAELGRPHGNVFSTISELPVAAASLGQVYKATLLPGGEVVAVKIQRPGLAHQIALDSFVLRIIAHTLQRMSVSRSDLVAIIDQLVGRMFEEVDYTKEADNAERFARLFTSQNKSEKWLNTARNSSKFGVKVPRIFRTLSTKRVLVMEWVDGMKLTNREAIGNANLNAKRIVSLGVECSLCQILDEGYFHADPHPGNLAVTAGGQLVYFDFGMTSVLQKQLRIGLIRTLVNFVNKDAEGLTDDFHTLGFLPPNADLAQIRQAVQESFEDPKNRSNTDFQGVMMQLSSIMYRFQFRLPPEFALVIRALGALEGTATALDPTFKVVSSAYPLIVRRLLADTDPAMREILRRLLIGPDSRVRWQRVERLLTAMAENEQHSAERGGANISTDGACASEPSGRDASSSGLDKRASVRAASDLLEFVLSESGAAVRTGIVEDTAMAAETAMKYYTADCAVQQRENGSEEQAAEDPSKRIFQAVQSVSSTVGSAPELWVPLFVKCALRREARDMAATLTWRITQSLTKSKSEQFWVSVSRQLRKWED